MERKNIIKTIIGATLIIGSIGTIAGATVKASVTPDEIYVVQCTEEEAEAFYK